MVKTKTLRRPLTATRMAALALLAVSALLGAHTLHGAQAKSPVGVTYKIVGPSAATAGQTVAYTINVSNPNAVAATNIDIHLAGNDSALLTGYLASAGLTCTPIPYLGTIGERCSLASLAPGASAGLTLNITLSDASAPTYVVGGDAAASGYLTLMEDIATTVTPTPVDPAAQPYVPAPNYNGENFDPNAGPNGPA